MNFLDIKRNIPINSPFAYLHVWLVNRILYSVVVAFLGYKGWKKSGIANDWPSRKTSSQKPKDAFVLKAKEIRKDQDLNCSLGKPMTCLLTVT